MTLEEAIRRARALPCWRSPGEPQPLAGGITNLNLTVRDSGRVYVVRLGEDIPEHGVMRFNELAISRAAAAAGVSPAVHYFEAGVMVLDFVNASPLNEVELADRETLDQVLKLLKRVHTDVADEVAGPVLTFWVFHVISDYIRTLRRLDSPHVPLLDDMLRVAGHLEHGVGAIKPVLSHNDLLPANILRSEERLWLIDWEYGGFNSALFDLGGLSSNAGLDAETTSWMLDTWFEGETPVSAFEAMKCASLLRETLWSMVSELTSSIDFDYQAYTATNLERYHSALEKTQL